MSNDKMREACRELVEWWDTGVCRQDGEVEAVRLELEADRGDADMRDAEREITNRLVRQAALTQQPESQEPVYYCRQDAIDTIGGAHIMHHKPVSEFNVPLYKCPQPYAQVPEGYAILPRELTAENGAKYLMVGEFEEAAEETCGYCFGEPEGEDCEVCGGSGVQVIRLPVQWSTIKDIYRKVVLHLATPSIPEKEKGHE